MLKRDNPESPSFSSSHSRRELLLATPAVAAAGVGLAYPAAARAAANAKHQTDCLARDSVVRENIKTFHFLDFHVFNHQQWDKIGLSHSEDVVAHWPDGRTTVGIDAHIEDLKAFFAWAPDTKVVEHTWLFGGGEAAEFTGCIAIVAGTFTEPMPIGGGNAIPPTGKHFRIRFSTTAHWTPDGVLDEEYLIWDNQEMGRQLGLV
jgi:hypothetical protein